MKGKNGIKEIEGEVKTVVGKMSERRRSLRGEYVLAVPALGSEMDSL